MIKKNHTFFFTETRPEISACNQKKATEAETAFRSIIKKYFTYFFHFLINILHLLLHRRNAFQLEYKPRKLLINYFRRNN